MLNINRALNKDRRLRGLTGLNRTAFDDLLPTFTSELEKARLIPPEPPRQRAFGGRRQGKLASPAEKLLFILFYLKCDPTFEVAGVLFDCDASPACRCIPGNRSEKSPWIRSLLDPSGNWKVWKTFCGGVLT